VTEREGEREREKARRRVKERERRRDIEFRGHFVLILVGTHDKEERHRE